MAIKKISEFVSGTPASDSKILFEQNGKGKNCSIGEAVNTCSLSYEEIMATNPVPDLTGKVASAGALKTIGSVKKPIIIGSNVINSFNGTHTFPLEQGRIYLFACMHTDSNTTGFAIIGTYGSTASIRTIVSTSLVTLSADGYTLTITIEYGHVWSLIQLD